MKHLRIKTFIRLTVIIVTVLSLTILTGLLVVSFSHNELKEIRNAAKQKSDEIVDVLENEGLEAASSNERLKYKVEDYASDQNGRVMIIGRDYMVLMDSAKANENSYLINDKVMELMKGDAEEVSYDTDDSLVIMTPVKSSDMVVGALIYKASTIEAKNNIKSQVTMSIIVLLIILAVDIIIIRIISARAVKDINDVNEKIMHNALGNLQDRLPEDEGFIEVQVLSENYNDVLEKLSTIDQTRSEFVSNVSHELKTPITSIKGYCEGLMDGVANTPEKQERYIRTIYLKANDMNTLINELTLYSQIDNDKIPYNFHKINVADYFGDCVEEIGMDMESRGITLNYSNMVSPDTMIIADPEQLKKVINNIVGNSVKYMDKEEGRIDIRILDEQDSVRVEIEDNGKGIAAKDLPNIFDRFYRTDESRNSAQGGSGIGLSIVRKVIEDHGGYVWATSREGEGTCVHFVIRKYHETSDMDDYVEEI